MDQPFELDLLRFSALNRDGGLTLNYPDPTSASVQLFAGASNSAGDRVDLSDRLDPDGVALIRGAGQLS